ncbi:hypothetical protein G6F34_012334 [Rhizopus arrhizus]|nr:hypothetical protein G6F34_012334 [Rhizopus arrhizus]
MHLFGKRFTKTSSINYIRSITNLKLNIKQTANIAPFKGGKSSKTLLLSEQIQRLNARFLAIRRQLACFNCSQSDTILFNDNNDTITPPQPGFICKSCSKTFSSNAMVDFIKTTTNSPFEEDTNAMEVSSPFVTNPDTNIGTAVISFAELQQARDEIEQLHTHLAQKSNETSTADDYDSHYLLLLNISQPLSPWGDTDRLNRIKQSMTEKCEQCHIQRQETAACLLKPSFEN